MYLSLRLLRLHIRAACIAAWIGINNVPLFSQSVYNLEHLTPEDGLSFRWAFDITQDSMGFIWIATFDGLNRYDGHRFVSYRPNYPDYPEFEANRFLQVDCLSGHDILATTPKGILLRLNRSKDQLELVWPKAKDYPVKARMLPNASDGACRWALLGDKNSADERLAGILSPAHFDTILLLDNHPRIHKQAMGPPGAKRFWCRSDWMYFAFDLDKRTGESHPFQQVPGVKTAHPELPIDGLNRFWHPDPAGGFRSFQLPLSVPVAQWEQFRLDNKGNFWIWTRGKNMFRYCPSSEVTEAMGLFDFWEYTISSPFEDREGCIWIPHFYGVTRLVPRRRLFENYLSRPLNALGVAPGGNSISTLAEGTDGAVYIKIPGPAYCRLRPEANALDPGVRVAPLKNDDEDKLARQALDILRPSDPLQSDNLIYHHDPQNHLLWLCLRQSKGLYRFDTRNLKAYRYFDLSPAAMTISAVVLHDGYIWVGHHEGLIRYDPKTGSRQHFTTREWLPHNIVYSILQDGPMLWIGTHNGLCRFDTRTNETKNYYVEDGLTHNEFNTRSALRTSDGKMYFGGLNGLIAFRPADLEAATPRYRPSLYLTRFSKLDGRKDSLVSWNNLTADGLNEIHLHPADRSVAFEFSINSYVNPTQNKYLYYLDNWESPWSNETRDGRAVYQYLPPGNYVLRVKATDPFGNPAGNEIALPIEMPRVWYLRWWACLFYAAALLFGGRMLYRIRLRQHLEHQEAMRLRELDQFKSRLFTNITHEFRTPLTVILGVAEQLENQAPGEEKFAALPIANRFAEGLKNRLALIRRNGRNLLDLVNQLLDLAKAENNQLKVHLVQGDVVQYLRYITESFHSVANQNNILLRVSSKIPELVMDYDPEKLRQILTNLIANALKFTPSGGTVEVRLTADDGQKMLIVSVADTGRGIASEDLPHVFDRFYQADNSESKAGGTGIGLALTRELVKLLDGRISAESIVGKGATFTVWLPITHIGSTLASAPKEQEDVAPVSVYASSHLPIVERSAAEGLPQLLIVEDNPDVVEYLRLCLDKRYHLDFAYNGRAGIEKAFELAPDLILSDVMMPEKDGFEVCDALKNDGRTSHIPIVLLTARADVESRIAGLRRGAEAYLAKPFHPGELLATLQNLLDTRRKLQEKYRSALVDTPLPTSDPAAGPDPEDAFLQNLRQAVEERLADPDLSFEEICRVIGMGKTNLYAKLSALTGMSFNIYMRTLRLQKARHILQTTDLNVSEVAYEVGFNDPKYFSRMFAEAFGMPPSEAKSK